MQNLHSDIDALLLELDSSFGVMELLHDSDLQSFCDSSQKRSVKTRRVQHTADEHDGHLTREAAATSAAASRFKMAAEQSAQLAARARSEMQARRRDAVTAATCAAPSSHAACECLFFAPEWVHWIAGSAFAHSCQQGHNSPRAFSRERPLTAHYKPPTRTQIQSSTC